VISLLDKKTNKEDTLEVDVCLLATGRVPYTKSLGLENVGITIDKYGRIPVD
jgi:dihydrolipoamide dehydrogenase